MTFSIARRRFVRRATGAVAALCVSSRITTAAEGSGSDARRAGQDKLDDVAFKRLASSFAGELILPDRPEYAAARGVFNLAFDRHPVLVARCANAVDIARVIEFSRKGNLPFAVRGGGHNRAGLSTTDGVVIDLSRMNRVEVDARRGVARVQGGALAVQLDAAAQRFGMATTSAGCPTVGVAGLTLGGGEGFLMSKFGAACDNLISARLVTSEGKELEASEKANADLFWAIRGGGGNFGILTELEYRLHPLSEVLAGILKYSAGRVSELLFAFARFVLTAPDEMNVVGVLASAERSAQFQIIVCHCGGVGEGNRLLGSLRALDPQQDTIRVASYLEANATINPAAPAAHFQTNLFLTELNAKAIGALVTATEGAPPGMRVLIVPIYGAITRVPMHATAFPLRTFGYELDIMGRWVDPADKARAVRWVENLRDALRPFARGAYVNQLGETSEALVRFAYGSNYARLAAIKKKFDPANILRSNQNIVPA